MRRFTSVCIDNITKAEMVLSECSFNEACMFLEMESTDGKLGAYKGTEYVGCNVSKLSFEKAVFLYDEERGLLLKR